MGQSVSDPDGVEGGGQLAGMGLFDFETVFAGEKITRQSSGTFCAAVSGIFGALSGKAWEGYEIHHGQTVARAEGAENASEDNGGGAKAEKLLSCGGSCRENLYGCYIHGIFDAPGVADTVLRALQQAKGQQEAVRPLSRAQYKERQYDLLAEAVRRSIDMEQLYRIIQL